jgi:hypothetical protein
MVYEDTWCNGKLVSSGIRQCGDRYNIVKGFCESIKPVSVLDIGANMCYFGLRLIEDFNCSVMAFEYDHFYMRMDNVRKNKTDKLMLLERKLSLPDLAILKNCCHFDIVLAMSVLHHLPGDTQEWISAMRGIGDYVIAEFALDDSKRPNVRKNYFIPSDAIKIGSAKSHLLDGFNRPIVVMKGVR